MTSLYTYVHEKWGVSSGATYVLCIIHIWIPSVTSPLITYSATMKRNKHAYVHLCMVLVCV